MHSKHAGGCDNLTPDEERNHRRSRAVLSFLDKAGARKRLRDRDICVQFHIIPAIRRAQGPRLATGASVPLFDRLVIAFTRKGMKIRRKGPETAAIVTIFTKKAFRL
jgi:hypothetical protein